jgi:hypothetical protein
MPPPRMPKTVNVVLSAVLATLWSTWPPPPIPNSALNMPGQQKHTRPMRDTWTRGELYVNVDLLGAVAANSSSPSKSIRDLRSFFAEAFKLRIGDQREEGSLSLWVFEGNESREL